MKIKSFFTNLFKKQFDMYIPQRRAGNTTRLIDKYVQDFFNKGQCTVRDHYNTSDSNKRVFRMVLERLSREHRIIDKDVELDTKRFIIKRVDIEQHIKNHKS